MNLKYKLMNKAILTTANVVSCLPDGILTKMTSNQLKLVKFPEGRDFIYSVMRT